MASGGWDFSTANKYITGNVTWSSRSNGSVANNSTVYVDLYYKKSSSSTAATKGTLKGYLCGTYYSKYVTLSCNNSWVHVASVSFTVAHNSNGTGSTKISASGAISGTTFSSSSTEGTIYLDTIPRYASINTWSNTKVELTSASFSWTTNANVSKVSFSLNDGAASQKYSGSASSGSFTITGLEPNTSYKGKITVVRADSGLSTTSSNISFKTKALASVGNESIDLTIGNNLTITFKDKNNSSSVIHLDVIKEDGTWENDIKTETIPISTASYTWNLAAIQRTLYEKVINRNSAQIRIRCTSSDTGKNITSSITSGTMIVVNSNPFFENYDYGDISSIASILGNNKYMIQGQGNMTITIPASEKAIPKNSAIMKTYVVSILLNNKSVVNKNIAFSSSNINIPIGNFSSTGIYTISIHAVDSRGNISNKITKTFTVLSYKVPSETSTFNRQNNYGTPTTMNVTPVFASVKVGNIEKNVIRKISYRSKKAGGTYGAITSWITNAASGSSYVDVINLDNDYSWIVEVIVEDSFTKYTHEHIVPQGVPIMAQLDNGIVTINKMPPNWNSPAQFQSGTDIMLTYNKEEVLIGEQLDFLLNRIITSANEPTSQPNGGYWIKTTKLE